MWLQYDISRETFAELVKREFKRNPPEPVDVLESVTGGVVKEALKVHVSLKGVEFTHVPPVGRKISDGSSIKADTMALVLDLQPRLVSLVGAAPPVKLARCKATYRFSAYLEGGKIKFAMAYIDSQVANDPGTLAYEKWLKKGFADAARDGIPGPDVTRVVEKLGLDPARHPVLDVGIAAEALRPRDIDLLIDIDPVSKNASKHWDMFFTKAGQTFWGDRGDKPVALTLWSNLLVWYVESQVKKTAKEFELPGAEFTYGKMTRRAAWGKIDSTWLMQEGVAATSALAVPISSCWSRHGVFGTFTGTGRKNEQDAPVRVDWFARFTVNSTSSMLGVRVDLAIYTDVSTGDYIKGFFVGAREWAHDLGDFVGNVLTGNGVDDDEGPQPPPKSPLCPGTPRGETAIELELGPVVADDENIGTFSARNARTFRFMDSERFAEMEGGQRIAAMGLAAFAASDGFLSIAGDLVLPPE